jgi:exodeoxyribonuclease VII large subunit
LEDLAPFNEEALARAISRCSIPVVSAVGHETDFTICDFAADLRAPTPSAAAELAVPRRDELSDNLYSLRRRLIAAERRCIADRQDRLASLKERFKDPRRFLVDQTLRVDDLRERLERAWNNKTRMAATRLKQLELSVQHLSPASRIREKKIFLANLGKNIGSAWHRYIRERTERLAKNTALLTSLSPLFVLQRGYSITRRLPEGDIVREADRLTQNQRIHVQLAAGGIEARVEKILGE